APAPPPSLLFPYTTLFRSVLFNNAGYGLAGPLEGTTDEQLRRQLDTNLLGVIRTTQAFLPHFREKRSGVIITTTSIGGHIGLPRSEEHTSELQSRENLVCR